MYLSTRLHRVCIGHLSMSTCKENIYARDPSSVTCLTAMYAVISWTYMQFPLLFICCTICLSRKKYYTMLPRVATPIYFR